MTTYLRRSSLALAVVVLAACGADRTTATRSDAVLSDGRNDGAAGFFFLPPVAPEPGGEHVNDPGLSPKVEIAEVGTGTVLATFDGDAVKASDEHYMAHWSTKLDVPVAGTTYRISVLLDGKTLGFADAQVAMDGKQLRLLASNEIFGLTGQRTVPIKFRIHAVEQDLCATVSCPLPAQCQSAVACDPATGACVATDKPAGDPCSDGNGCTTGDQCDGAGVCQGGAVSCPDLGQCNPRIGCDPETGCLYDHLQGTPCTQTATDPMPGVPGVCQLNPTTGLSQCYPFTPGKLTR